MLGSARIFSIRSRRSRTEQAETHRQESASPPIGEKAEASDANETLGKQVEQETTQELICREGHGAIYVAVRAVSPEEGDVAIVKGNQAVVGNGHPMCIAAEVAHYIFRPAEGPLAVDDPFVTEQLTHKGVEHLSVRERPKLSVEADLASCESVLQSFFEFAPKDEPQHLFRKQEAVARMDPALVIEGESTRGNDAVDMRMKFHFLAPGVQHAEEADLGTETFRIASDFGQGFGADTKQEGVNESLVLERKRRQLVGEREDDVSVGDRKELFTSPLNPAQSGVGLALGAVAIATRVIGDGLISTAGT